MINYDKSAENTLKDRLIPYFLMLFFGLFCALILPIIPIDETRYLSVAWEMYWRKSFIVPVLNGMPYSHKTPFLFWLIHLSWFIFGVNSITPRLIVLFFSILSMYLSYKISLLIYSGRSKPAGLTLYFLPSFFLWLIWSVSIMFDIILLSFALCSIYFLLKYLFYNNGKYLFFCGLSLGFGMLAKGPVVILYLLPIYISFYVFRGKYNVDFRKILKMFFLHLILGTIVFSLWFIPALICGGKDYRSSILFEQTAGRVVDSFAHNKPFWWYFSIMPFLFLPLIFSENMWRAIFFLIKKYKNLFELKILMLWIFILLAIFSLISSKQIYYIIPILPFSAIVFGGVFERFDERKFTFKGLSLFFIIIGMLFVFLPALAERKDYFFIGIKVNYFIFGGALLLMLGFFLFKLKISNTVEFARLQFVFVLSFLIFFIVLLKITGLLDRYDIKKPSLFVKQMQEKGKKVAFVGKYHNEFGFNGRLKKKIFQLNGNRKVIIDFVKNNKNCIIMESLSIKDKNKRNLIFSRALKYWYYRGKVMSAWKGSDYIKYWLPVSDN